MRKTKIIVTCEHAGNKIPSEYKRPFAGKKKLLLTHQGYDIGALSLARKISKALSSDFIFFDITRLLIDANRSLTNRDLFSGISRKFTQEEKKEILENHYLPYRNTVTDKITRAESSGEKIIHLSVHTFTPLMGIKKRNTDIGILFDPAKKEEKTFSEKWKKTLSKSTPALRVRFNYPYKGISDGLTSFLRKRFPEKTYTGIELEVNQKHFLNNAANPVNVCKPIITSLKKALFCSQQQD